MTYINDIYEAPVYHWIMFIKNNNLAFLQKDAINKNKKDVVIEDYEEAEKAYFFIKDQITEEFGVDEKLEEERSKEEDIFNLKLEYIITGDRFKQTMYQLKEAARKPKEEGGHDFNKEMMSISKSLGGNILDIKKTTIHQYYSAKNSLSNG